MTKLDCEIVCMAAMAVADGFDLDVSADQIESHLVECPGCRREVGQLREMASFLDAQQRLQRTESVWTRVEGRLPEAALTQRTSKTWYPFMILGLLLLSYRIVQMLPGYDFGFLFKLVPVLFMFAAFSYLRENPFKINAELRLEGE